MKGADYDEMSADCPHAPDFLVRLRGSQEPMVVRVVKMMRVHLFTLMGGGSSHAPAQKQPQSRS